MRTGGFARQRVEPRERQREVAAALVAGDRMDLVHDHRARRGQHRAARRRSQEHVQRLGRRDEDVRWTPAHAGARRLRRVAGAHERADRRVVDAHRRKLRRECPASGIARLRSTSLDNALSGDTYTTCVSSASEPATACRTRSSIDARNAASVFPEPVGAATSTLRPGLDLRPCGELRRRGRGKARREPALDGGVETMRSGHRRTRWCRSTERLPRRNVRSTLFTVHRPRHCRRRHDAVATGVKVVPGNTPDKPS